VTLLNGHIVGVNLEISEAHLGKHRLQTTRHSPPATADLDATVANDTVAFPMAEVSRKLRNSASVELRLRPRVGAVLALARNSAYSVKRIVLPNKSIHGWILGIC